jgi:hypothetical protein
MAALTVMIVASVTARKAEINAEDAEKDRRDRGESLGTRAVVRIFIVITLVMAFYPAGYCAYGWSGFGYGVGPGSFCGGAQD